MQETLFTAKRATCINFTDDDLLIGATDHNRLLYIIGNYAGKKIVVSWLTWGPRSTSCRSKH
jgi:hypothetical protein